MDKNTKKKSDEILRLFKAGSRLLQICELTSSSQSTVKKVLRSFGIDYDEWAEDDYRKRIEQIPVLYAQGKPQTFIEQQLHLTRKTIRNVLKSLDGVEYKSKSEQHRLRHVIHSISIVLMSLHLMRVTG